MQGGAYIGGNVSDSDIVTGSEGRLAGDTITDAPPPEGKKKKKLK